MKAIHLHTYGGTENLVYEETSIPSPGSGEVLVKVKAAGVNPLDLMVRKGWLQSIIDYPMPIILGLDLSGVVAAIGEGVTHLQVGQDVYGITDIKLLGTYAEYAIAPSDKVVPKPKNLDYVQAASVPSVGITAWQALFDVGGLSAGQTVLVHAAAGGVGSFAVQLAKAKGAKVIGTASSQNLDFVSSLGADQVIDYKTTRFEEVVSNVDVVLDTIGGETRERSWGILKPGGILVSLITSDPASSETAAEYGVRTATMFVKLEGKYLTELAALLDNGTIKTCVDKVLPLTEASQAHELIESGGKRGKIVLNIAS
ncbi:NADP-dependent oxidoreductase [Tolypothrix sp. PCC 7910]|nr:NADP-dependent oxidoreductase [Tolypothrix sp. PCC 7910]